MHVMATVPLVGGADSTGGTLEQRARADYHMACLIFRVPISVYQFFSFQVFSFSVFQFSAFSTFANVMMTTMRKYCKFLVQESSKLLLIYRNE